MDAVILFLIIFAVFLFIAYRASGPTSVKFRVVNKAWWMFWARGMVMWPWVWMKYRKVNPNPEGAYEEAEAKQNAALNVKLFRHELQHCYQIARMGRVKFYIRYLALSARHGYKKHPYEIEANERENDPLTEQEQQWYANGKIIL